MIKSRISFNTEQGRKHKTKKYHYLAPVCSKVVLGLSLMASTFCRGLCFGMSVDQLSIDDSIKDEGDQPFVGIPRRICSISNKVTFIGRASIDFIVEKGRCVGISISYNITYTHLHIY